MIGGVVITDRCVKSARARRKIRIRLVSKGVPFNVGTEHVGGVRTEHHFREKAEVFGQLGGKEQIEFAGLKRRVRRRGRVPARSASAVDNWIDQRVCDGSYTEVKVEEPSDVQH